MSDRFNAPGSRIDPTARVHPTAEVEGGVVVGAQTAVWHRAVLRTRARIGRDCVIGRDAFIDVDVVIGDRVKIQNAALVYHGTTVEDGVFIGPNVILTNDRHPRAITPSGNLAGEEDWQISPIVLRHGCSIGAGAIVVAGVDVGRFAVVGAGAVVTRTVPDHALVAGNPARRLGWVCSCGRRLQDGVGQPAPPDAATASELRCAACHRTFVYIADEEALRESVHPNAGAPA